MAVQEKFPAVYMRGGTSRGVFFHRRDLPADPARWDALFLALLGSPDPYGRQLDGLGVGISSLSKVVVVGPPSHPAADVDYTFAQVGVEEATVDYHGICGNLTSAVGPFAVDEGLVPAEGAEALVRIHNTNTAKIIHARFPLRDGQAAVEGDFRLAGVSGAGAPVRLEFKEPGGAATGRLLPSGKVVDALQVPGVGEVEVSLVDATNPVVFVAAEALGLRGNELPREVEGDPELLRKIEAVRCAGAVRMGMAPDPETASRELKLVPFLALVAPPMAARNLAGEQLGAEEADLTVRVISVRQAHRAVPLSAAMCMAVAARIEGTLVHALARPPENPENPEGALRLAHPSGVNTVAATVVRRGEEWLAEQAVVFRTARRLMEGSVLVPASVMQAPRMPALLAAPRRRSVSRSPRGE
ncbi:MAG: PrpF family protein [SAR324 cluster bacterium]|nr:PrpF family protein [SAR324 cluster bacterium]